MGTIKGEVTISFPLENLWATRKLVDKLQSVEHTKDADCLIDGETLLCIVCGVDHSGPECGRCGDRAFHGSGCEVCRRCSHPMGEHLDNLKGCTSENRSCDCEGFDGGTMRLYRMGRFVSCERHLPMGATPENGWDEMTTEEIVDRNAHCLGQEPGSNCGDLS